MDKWEFVPRETKEDPPKVMEVFLEKFRDGVKVRCKDGNGQVSDLCKISHEGIRVYDHRSTLGDSIRKAAGKKRIRTLNEVGVVI